MTDSDHSRRLRAGLLLGGIFGLLFTLLALGFRLSGSLVETRERAAVANLAGSRPGLARRASDPAFERIFVLDGKEGRRYGIVARIPSAYNGNLVGLLFDKEARLVAFRLLGSDLPERAELQERALAAYLGRSFSGPVPRRRADFPRPEALSGASVSVGATGAVLVRAWAEILRTENRAARAPDAKAKPAGGSR